MMHVGDIVSTVGGVQFRERCNLLLFECLHGTEPPPTVLVISPRIYHNIPHGTEYPPLYSSYPLRY